MNPPIPGLWLAGDILLGIAALVALLFVLLFRRTDWKANELGKFMMYFILTIFVILTYALIVSYFHVPLLAVAVSRFLLYLAVVVQLTVLVVLLLRYQKQAFATEKEGVDDE